MAAHNRILLSETEWNRFTYRLNHMRNENIDGYFRAIDNDIQVIEQGESTVVRTNSLDEEAILSALGVKNDVFHHQPTVIFSARFVMPACREPFYSESLELPHGGAWNHDYNSVVAGYQNVPTEYYTSAFVEDLKSA